MMIYTCKIIVSEFHDLIDKKLDEDEDDLRLYLLTSAQIGQVTQPMQFKWAG